MFAQSDNIDEMCFAETEHVDSQIAFLESKLNLTKGKLVNSVRDRDGLRRVKSVHKSGHSDYKTTRDVIQHRLSDYSSHITSTRSQIDDREKTINAYKLQIE